MATYKEIQEFVKKKYGYSVKTCWIAHMKEIKGLNPRVAPNRESLKRRKHPCPKEKRKAIEDAFRNLGVL